MESAFMRYFPFLLGIFEFSNCLAKKLAYITYTLSARIVVTNEPEGCEAVKRLLFWLRRKQRIREKRCGQCCLTCRFYEECSNDGASYERSD
ncbi:hypothetical protein SAMN02910358_01842 [Lachnospiraceae bacterium XBB1006]|nr:hypothetical protein SAMN02910358_01842 [Lachnospiraceae bacterium XBB1006]